MNKAMLTVGLIMMSLLALFVINVIQSYATGSELDYYLLKETTEASMIDAVDEGFFRKVGQVRIDKEKFVESFLRRFSTEVERTRDYKIGFYDLNETPPKVSVKVESGTMYSFPGQTYDDPDAKPLKINTKITMVLTDYNEANATYQDWYQKCYFKTGDNASCFKTETL